MIGPPRRPTVWRSLGAGVVTLSALACLSRATATASDPPPVEFDRDVRPILAGNCFECHGPDADARKAKLRFDTPDDVFVDRDGYQVIVPGKPAQSALLDRVTSRDPDVQMPPPESSHKKLSDAQVDVLKRWIKEGANWSEHWAFIPPQRPGLPEVEDGGWPRNEIDHFIHARLKKEGLEPSPTAERTTLLRRVTLALTGLPPTVAETDRFLADTSADAYEKVIDRLLKSPRFGEHMALAWLDAARYSDTSGYQADWERHMWPWRDWVVAAYNTNMPFDQFTIEQLAGDLLPEATVSQQLATGFNRNHRINDEGGSLDAEFEVEYVVDRVDTTSTVWLGLSAGCARCHDHKFDPISQKEYYRLYAFFNNVPEKGIDGRKGAAKPFIEIPNRDVERQLGETKRELDEAGSALEKAGGNDEKLKKQIESLKDAIKKLEPRAKTQVMVMQELPKRRPTYLLKRGDYRHPDKSEALSPALPSLFKNLPGGDKQPDRLSLAKWLVGQDNPLTARVIVNRLWQHHFGSGLVRTSEDFGTRGERPSHPDLLDWLATEFVRSGWDVKAMHRLITNSATFRQSSRVSPALLERDPANRLLARGPRRRLTGAAIRDQALFVSGLLSPKMGGPSVKPYQPEGLWKELSFATGKTTVDFYVQDHGESLYRRSLYTFWKRTVAPPLMSMFDGGGREMCQVRADTTNTPMQALTLQNDVTFVEAARHLARRMLKEGGEKGPDQLVFGWRLALGREPTLGELTVLQRALDRNLMFYHSDNEQAQRLLENGESEHDGNLNLAEHAAFTIVAQILLNLDETITLE